MTMTIILGILIAAALYLAYRLGYSDGQNDNEEIVIKINNQVDVNLIESVLRDQGWTVTKPQTNGKPQEAKTWVN